MKIKELSPIMFQIRNPQKCVLQNTARKLSIDYLINELEWYKSGDLNIKIIGEQASMWKSLADKNDSI